MQDDDRRASRDDDLMADIRRIVQEEGRPRPPAAFEPASAEGVFALTPAMRTGAALPRGPLPPAEDEEPPLILTRRIDQPEQPFGTGSAATPPQAEPPAAAPQVETPAPEREDPASPPILAELQDEPPARRPEEDPAPEVFADIPDAPPAEAPGASPILDPEQPKPTPPFAETGPQDQPAPGAAARPPRFGAPFGQGAAPRDIRRALSSESAPGPIAASGLPRSREELLALTRQAIREELAGPLGERISQNIKLLIEREVRRALAERARDEDDASA